MTRSLWLDSPFMKAARCEPTDYTPVWMMRQAGRYQAHYRAIRKQGSFLDLCKSPELAAEVMLHAVELLDVDAAIIFSDLLPILEPLGLELEFIPGQGPVIHNPIREASDVDRVRELEDLEPLSFVFETVEKTRAGLDERLPLIGFAGAPFTLLAYAIEGGSSRNYGHTKRLMYTEPEAWNALMARVARATVRYLKAFITRAKTAYWSTSWAWIFFPVYIAQICTHLIAECFHLGDDFRMFVGHVRCFAGVVFQIEQAQADFR